MGMPKLGSDLGARWKCPESAVGSILPTESSAERQEGGQKASRRVRWAPVDDSKSIDMGAAAYMKGVECICMNAAIPQCS
jgi:hypothetical protein